MVTRAVCHIHPSAREARVHPNPKPQTLNLKNPFAVRISFLYLNLQKPFSDSGPHPHLHEFMCDLLRCIFPACQLPTHLDPITFMRTIRRHVRRVVLSISMAHDRVQHAQEKPGTSRRRCPERGLSWGTPLGGSKNRISTRRKSILKT